MDLYSYFEMIIKMLKDINSVKTTCVRIINSFKGIMI